MVLLILSIFLVLLSAAPVPFRIEVSDEVLADLKGRLERTRFPDAIEDDNNWKSGASLNYLKEFVTYWKDNYNWRKEEEKLNNNFPQFTTSIWNQTLHFVHVRSKYPPAQPLLIVHGWPGSFFEFHKIIPMLVDPVAYGGKPEDAFHVVAPSIPGYGFSSAPSHFGFDQVDAAKMFIELMRELNYGDRYWTQGGDWGSILSGLVAHFDKNVIGYHTNFPISNPPWGRGVWTILKNAVVFAFPSLFIPENEMANFRRNGDILRLLRESGYFHQQSTKPQTLGYGLNDSPTGLAAWILEKFHTWADCKGDLESVFTKDELITNIMLYWTTGRITSSTRFYYEMVYGKNDVFNLMSNIRIETPTAVANFPAEVTGGVRRFCEYYYNIQHWSLFSEGGHFAAMEVPLTLAKDIWSFRRLVESKLQKPKDEI